MQKKKKRNKQTKNANPYPDIYNIAFIFSGI